MAGRLEPASSPYLSSSLARLAQFLEHLGLKWVGKFPLTVQRLAILLVSTF